MDIGQVTGFIGNNWELVTGAAVTVGGAYAVKVKLAIDSVIDAIEDMKQTHNVIANALADKTVSADEAEIIGRELGEDIAKLQVAAKNISSILPARFRKKLPVEFS